MSLSVARERWAMARRDCLNVSSLKVWFVAAWAASWIISWKPAW